MNVTTGRYYCDEVSPLRPLHAFLSLFVDSLDGNVILLVVDEKKAILVKCFMRNFETI